MYDTSEEMPSSSISIDFLTCSNTQPAMKKPMEKNKKLAYGLRASGPVMLFADRGAQAPMNIPPTKAYRNVVGALADLVSEFSCIASLFESAHSSPLPSDGMLSWLSWAHFTAIVLATTASTDKNTATPMQMRFPLWSTAYVVTAPTMSPKAMQIVTLVVKPAVAMLNVIKRLPTASIEPAVAAQMPFKEFSGSFCPSCIPPARWKKINTHSKLLMMKSRK
mmetsp:Transcript_95747/g.166341  ORF Transcript_95747/g.166341 Transcript_95747/m.166341 type:complete len:221 (-) Transcript_95747:353-1015(-)